MRRYRIGIDAGLACSRCPTGVEHFARSLLLAVTRLETPEIAWYVYLSPRSEIASLLPASVQVRERPDVNTLVKKPWLVSLTWRDRLDVLYTFGHQLVSGCRGRKVLTIYDTAFDAYPDCYPAGVPARVHGEVAEACRQAAAIVTISNATRCALLQDYPCRAEQVHVVYGGNRAAVASDLPPALPECVREAGVRPPFFLCVGRLDRRKNLERVIRAYRRLLQEGTSCGGLVLAGPDDSGSEDVRAQIAADTVEGERIVATGYVDEATLIWLYKSAAALVYPSLAEGFGLPVLEAMACGTPVITSKVSSLPEVGGEAALLVDPLDVDEITGAMRRLLVEGGLRERLVEAGYEQAEKFTWERSGLLLHSVLLKTASNCH
jgi:glycosyltransferase involved in cell wall biosynthesis